MLTSGGDMLTPGGDMLTPGGGQDARTTIL